MTAARVRSAFTLVEMIIGISVAMVITTLAVSLLTRHQRSYAALSALLDSRSHIRDGADMLSAELRGSSPSGDSLLVTSDTALELYSAIGSSTLCATPASNRIVVPPDTLASGRTLSAWLSMPDTGDYALVYHDSSASVSRGWQRFTITAFSSVATSSSCPVAYGLLTGADVAGGTRSYEVTFAPSVSVIAARGAPVRFIRRVRYSIYRASDGDWYLGYRRCGPSGCTSTQPASGPYRSDFGPPLALRYFGPGSSALTGTGPTTAVERVDIIFRASTRPWASVTGMVLPARDSSMTTVTLRNRW